MKRGPHLMPVAVSDLRGSRVRAKGDLATRLLYREILDSLWEHNGAIPADLDFLEDDLDMPREEIERCLPLLLKIGKHGRGGLRLGEDGLLRNERVTEDLAEALAFKMAQAERGRKGGLRSAERRSDSAEPDSSTAEAPLDQRSTTAQAAASDPQAPYPFPSSSPSPSPPPEEEEKQTSSPPAGGEPAAAAAGNGTLFPMKPPTNGKTRSEADRVLEAEIRWRVEECWRVHLEARSNFYLSVNGARPSVQPAFDPKGIGQPMRRSLLLHDRELLGADQREEWKRKSLTRAAGIGLFHDPWCSGTGPNATAGKRFLDPWRPWTVQAGKGDPVPRFAQFYFEIVDTAEVAGQYRRSRDPREGMPGHA